MATQSRGSGDIILSFPPQAHCQSTNCLPAPHSSGLHPCRCYWSTCSRQKSGSRQLSEIWIWLIVYYQLIVNKRRVNPEEVQNSEANPHSGPVLILSQISNFWKSWFFSYFFFCLFLCFCCVCVCVFKIIVTPISLAFILGVWLLVQMLIATESLLAESETLKIRLNFMNEDTFLVQSISFTIHMCDLCTHSTCWLPSPTTSLDRRVPWGLLCHRKDVQTFCTPNKHWLTFSTPSSFIVYEFPTLILNY